MIVVLNGVDRWNTDHNGIRYFRCPIFLTVISEAFDPKRPQIIRHYLLISKTHNREASHGGLKRIILQY